MTSKERQKRYREKVKALRSGAVSVTDEGKNVTVVTPSVTVGVMRTDRLFEEAKPGYYLFEWGEPWERKCWRCWAEYSTRLELNKFCSPACKEAWLKESFRHAGMKELGANLG